MAYVSKTDPYIQMIQSRPATNQKSTQTSSASTSGGAYVSDTDPYVKKIRGNAAAAPSYTDPLIEAARGGSTPKTPTQTDTEEPSFLDRVKDTFSGAFKRTVGSNADMMGVRYEATQGRRDTMYEQEREWAQHQLDRAEADLAAYTADGNSRMADVTRAEVEQLKQKLKAFDTVTEGQVQQKAATAARDLAAEVTKSGEADTERAMEGLGFVGKTAVALGTAGAEALGDAAIGKFLGVGGSLPLMSRVFGSGTQQRREEGASLGSQIAYGSLSASAAAGFNKLTQFSKTLKNVYGGGIVDIEEAIMKAASKLTKNAVGQQVLANMMGGFGEEAIEAALDPLIRLVTGDKGVMERTFGTKEAATDFVANVLYEGLIGGLFETTAKGLDVFQRGNATVTDETTQNAQNGAPNAPASRVGVEGDNNAPAPQNGTEAIVGANENGLTSLSDKEKSNLSSGAKNKVVSTFQEAVQFVRNAISDRTNTDRAYLGKVPNSVAQRVKQETGVDVTGLSVMVNGDDVRHILKKHGDPLKEAAKNQIPVTAEAIARIPEIIASPDSVSLSDTVDGKGRKAIVFEKQFGDTYITIQGVSNGKKLLQTDTMYIKKEKPRMTQFPMPDANLSTVPEINAQSDLPQRLSTDTVTPPDENVKRDVFAEDVRNRAQNPSVGAADAGFDPFSAAENKYGVIDGKARSVRMDDVPVSVDGVKKVSETVSTVKGAEATPDDFVPILETETMKGEFSFMPITNNETVQAAVRTIKDKGFQKALNDWTKAVHGGRVSQNTVVIGQLLYNNAVNSGDTQLALDILADYQQMGRSAARALQAMSIMQKLTPESRLYMIRRSVRNMVESLGEDVKITIPEELEQRYLNAQTDAEADAVLDEIAKNVALQIPSTFQNIWTTLRYTNMLGNFKTQVRNIVGNVGMLGVSGVKNAVSAGLERIAGTERTRSVFVDKSLREVGKADFDAVKSVVLQQGKYQEGSVNADNFAQLVENARQVNTTGNKYVDMFLTPLQKYSEATQWAMNNEVFGDAAFAKKNYARALSGYLKAQGITAEQWNDPAWQEENKATVRKAREFAVKDAQENTFRDSNKLSDWISRIGRRADTPSYARAISEGLAPFRRTPANIMLRAEEYSPLGLINTAVKAAQKAKGVDGVTGNDVIEQLAKSLTGTGLFALGMLGAMKGVLRGADDDDEKQAAFDDLRGHQPYSIEIGDQSFTLDWLTPASMPLFMGVEMMNALADNGLTFSDVEKSLTSIAQPMLEMSMMSGISDALDNVQYAENNLMQLALETAVGYLTQGLTNTLAGQIERTLEPNRMTTYIDKNKDVPSWLQYQLGRASAKGIGEYGQTEYIDAWGRTESSGNIGQRAFNNFLAPWYSDTVSNDPLEQEVQRLYDATGENVLPERAPKSFTHDKREVNLTAEQYTEYATTRGNELYDLMQKVVQSSTYKGASDSEKAEMLADAKTYADKKAKAEMGYRDGDSWATKADSAGIDPAAYIQYMLVTDGLTADKDTNGKTISGSKKEKVMAKINAMNITNAQKDALYLIEGYSENTISDAPWR